MWRKNDISECFVVGKLEFFFGLRKLLLLFYGGLIVFWPVSLYAAGFRLRVSPVFRSSLSLRYRGDSCSAAVNPMEFLSYSADSGTIDDLAYGDRDFIDGYVYRDAGTGQPDSVLPNSTWNWGYHYASQHDEEKQTLLFRKPVQEQQQSFEKIAGCSGSKRQTDRVNEQCGLEFALEMPFSEPHLLFSALSIGWQFIPQWNERGKLSNFQATYLSSENLLHGEDRYLYSTYGAELPPPGHAGSFDGPFADPPVPGTLIANQPSSVQRIYNGVGERLSSEVITFRNQVRFQLDCQQQEFWFGPVFRWLPFSWLNCSLSPRCNCLYSAMELKREEKLWQSSPEKGNELRGNWRHKREKQQLLVGTSISCAMVGEWENGFFAGLSLSAAWYPENLELRAGPGRVSFHASNFSVGGVFGYRF